MRPYVHCGISLCSVCRKHESPLSNVHPDDCPRVNQLCPSLARSPVAPVPQVAFVGFAVQALATRTTPIDGLTKHVADPLGKNITYYLTHIPETLSA